MQKTTASVLGIDAGTTYFKVAVMVNDKPKIVRINGKEHFASVVGIRKDITKTTNLKEKNLMVVGETAFMPSKIKTHIILRDGKRIIGLK